MNGANELQLHHVYVQSFPHDYRTVTHALTHAHMWPFHSNYIILLWRRVCARVPRDWTRSTRMRMLAERIRGCVFVACPTRRQPYTQHITRCLARPRLANALAYAAPGTKQSHASSQHMQTTNVSSVIS